MDRSYLNEIPRISQRITSLRIDAEKLRAKALYKETEYGGERVQTSASKKLESYIIAALDKEREADELEAELEARQAAVIRAAKMLDDPDQRRVIMWRYVDCYSWDMVAAMMCKSMRHVYRIADAAAEKMSYHVT